MKVIHSDPEEGKKLRETAIERAKTFDSEEFEKHLKADIKGDKVTKSRKKHHKDVNI